MADGPDRHDRTEEATFRQREKAREKGQVARSRELVSMAASGGIMLAVVFWGGMTISNLSGLMRRLLSMQYGMEMFTVIRATSVEALFIILPFIVTAAAFAIVASLAQGGLVIKPFEFKFSKLNPMQGLGRIFSAKGLTELGKNLLKVFAGGYVAWLTIKKELSILPSMLYFELSEVAAVAGTLIFKALLTGFFFFLIIAVIDYFIQWRQHEQSLKMTKHDVKEERKDMEGNPHVKARLRSLMRELARQRMMRDLPKANVVITNPTHIAVALQYDAKTMDAPVVIAKGADFLVDKIREVARRHGIPIVEDKPLARSLYKVDLGASVPEELYRAVARILAMIMSRHRSTG